MPKFMKKTKAHIRLIPALFLMLIILLTGITAAKYIQTISLSNTVTFKANLATEFLLQESKALHQEDGSYQLSATETVTGESLAYTLLPGVNIPKDIHIVISGKSEIPAYLFIEVVDSTANPYISYQLLTNKNETESLEDDTPFWIPSDIQPPRHNGVVYVYSEDGMTPAEITSDMTAYILENNLISVNQNLRLGEESNLLTIHAYLIEATAG